MEISDKISIKEIQYLSNNSKIDSAVILLPENFNTKGQTPIYPDSSIAVKKLVSSRSIEIISDTKIEQMNEKRSLEWFGPILLISSSYYIQNKEIIAVICGIISNYLTDIFKGRKKDTTSLSIIYEDKEKRKTTRLDYSGSIEGLDKVADAIRKIADK